MTEPEINPDTLEALKTLREYAKHSMVAASVCEAIELLDRQGHFKEIDKVHALRRAEANQITVREVPGGWIACQDNDRSKIVAEALLYVDLESKLENLDFLVHINRILFVGEDSE